MPDLVALQLPFTSGFARALDEVWAAGDAALPLAPGLPQPEVARLLADLKPARLVTPDGGRALEGAEPVESGTALVVPTSGTTGVAKGVVLSHASLVASATATAARLGLTPGDGARWLCCVPPSHVAGLMVIVRSRLAGTVPVMQPRFDPEAIGADREATLISVVPTMLRRLLAAGTDLSRFRWILLGGGAPAPDLVAAAQAAGGRIVTTYGMTETCGGCVYDGVPLAGVRVELGGDGEVLLSGPMVMQGYRLRPAESEAALAGGCFHTADAGEFDAAGRLRILGRRDDLIVTGGEKVSPAEVEAVLGEHPKVAEVAVAARPDPEWGQAVAAVVVPAPGQPPTLAELRAFVTGRLASYKAPKHLVLVDDLPRGPTGKPIGLA
ncbi:MAG TPA: fatty acid--CoA ligase family protein, partial [Acidimicrobiia bacterium]|nr:fatty acid--CoA ligase family protein [Acidimicrobiia bacterium]